MQRRETLWQRDPGPFYVVVVISSSSTVVVYDILPSRSVRQPPPAPPRCIGAYRPRTTRTR